MGNFNFPQHTGVEQRCPIIVFYDDYHTPVRELGELYPNLEVVQFLLARGIPDNCPAEGGRREIDLRDWFANCYIAPAIRANARYQQYYNLSTALERPALAEAVSKLLAECSNRPVVHGFAGNDQFRFEAGLLALCPEAQIISVADLLGSRTQANGDGYTRSTNSWGETLEGGPLADPAFASTAHIFSEADEIRPLIELEIEFEHGLPVGLDGQSMPLSEILEKLTEVGEAAGVTWHDMIEDGYVGLKTRALYRSPAADILSVAHGDLARITGSRRENAFRSQVEAQWSELIYQGGWFDPFRKVLDRYFEAADQYVTGTVRIALKGGQIRAVARHSDFALYDEAYAIYRVGQDFGRELICGLREQAATLGRLVSSREGGTRCDA